MSKLSQSSSYRNYKLSNLKLGRIAEIQRRQLLHSLNLKYRQIIDRITIYLGYFIFFIILIDYFVFNPNLTNNMFVGNYQTPFNYKSSPNILLNCRKFLFYSRYRYNRR